MSLPAWLRRRTRWQRIAGLMLLSYAVGVAVTIVLRLALRGWHWHPDVLTSSLIMGLMLPAGVLVQAALVSRSRD